MINFFKKNNKDKTLEEDLKSIDKLEAEEGAESDDLDESEVGDIDSAEEKTDSDVSSDDDNVEDVLLENDKTDEDRSLDNAEDETPELSENDKAENDAISEEIEMPTIGVRRFEDKYSGIYPIEEKSKYIDLMDRMFNAGDYEIETSVVYNLLDSPNIESDFDLYNRFQYVFSFTPLTNDFEMDSILRRGAILNAFHSSFGLLLNRSIVHATIVEHEGIGAPKQYELNVVYPNSVTDDLLTSVEEIFYSILELHGYVYLREGEEDEAEQTE